MLVFSFVSIQLLQDWQWDGQSGMPQNSRVREATAIHVTVGDRSSISYSLPMVTGPAGYRPVLEVHLDTVVITSSLNDIQMVTSESCRVGNSPFFAIVYIELENQGSL